ncbi:mitochondrial putative 3-oxoacyl-synthase [Staphylotrichum tortipilum]|uniref:3-oxoacyl-[acyl-carrier-protein] synthase, mitochondrial n=1 Tax=Staphylotrichum tortipilum TaxID=2831512 RepID=A0AAN6MKW6_9PEZI|nr:mitochondrial putative 3-oxoacyl-synthase [Staphylotrichum longicolle]
MSRRVVVTGLGAITPLGVGVRHTWQRLLASESGLVSIANRGADAHEQAQWRDLTSTVAGIVPLSPDGAAAPGHDTGIWRPSDWLEPSDQRRMSTFAQYAVAAADMALRDAAWKPESDRHQERDMTGVCIGSGIGNLNEIYATSLAFDRGGYKKVSPLFVPKILTNLAAGHIAMRHGFRGPNHAATTACTTGAHAIGDAARFIAFGDADVMVAGGAESCIHPLTFAGFGRSRSLSTAFNHDPPASCRPFDADRAGFVVAEGAAVVVLEELEHAKRRGARVLAELKGYGCSGDAYHMTAPREDGSGALAAMRRALKNAGVRPAEIDYINAHATGTVVGDAAEAAAIRTLMMGEDGVDDESKVTVSSTKGAVGHLLGAAGAIEAVFAILAIAENAVPPTLNLGKPSVGARFNFVPLQAQQKKVRVAMSNSFGFGGTNASLVFSDPAASLLRPTTTPTPSQPLLLTPGGQTPTTPTLAHPPRRALHTTPALHKLELRKTLLSRIAESLPNLNTYQVYGTTESMYKTLAARADYVIDPAARKAGTLRMAEDGEEIGDSKGGRWHSELALPPTFSTWAQVTMLHMYLLVVRFRGFDAAAQQAYQAPLVNHFFHEAEAKMEDVHHITSGAMRQRYLKDLFVQWRGLILAYDEGIVKGDAVLAAAVWRNLFKADEEVDVRALAAVVAWMRGALMALGSMSDEMAQKMAVAAIPDLGEQLKMVDLPTASMKVAMEQAAGDART